MSNIQRGISNDEVMYTENHLDIGHSVLDIQTSLSLLQDPNRPP